MKTALFLAALSAVAIVPSMASAGHICFDAPYLPGALAGYYDMWNNIYRHYTCHHVYDLILDRPGAVHFGVLLP